MKNNKKHAKFYLLKYKNKKNIPSWLSTLIQRTIDTNGKIHDQDKESIFVDLLKENKLESEGKTVTPPSGENVKPHKRTEVSPVEQQLTLQKITHIKGVNALIPNQPITFSPACTVIYGLNATGKSGYFRIIHELAGGDRTKSILDNIHNPGDGLEVDVDFLLDGKELCSYKWQDKSARGIVPFDRIKVFDSEYLPIFLNERESSVNIEPLGLNLFQVITSIIDEFKEKLNEQKQQKENQKPDLQSLIDIIHSDKLKLILQKESLSKKESLLVDDNKAFSSKEAIKLAELIERKRTFEKKDTEDSKKVLNQEKTEIDDLKTHLTNLKTNLETFTKDVSTAISDYLAKKKIRDERARQFEVLKNVPSQNSEEWQAFIESAKNYGKEIDQNVFNKEKVCIYCHQLLGDDALKLVQAYAEYLGDQSQQNFKDAFNEIEGLKARLDALVINPSFSKNLEKFLADIKNEHNQTYIMLVGQVIEEAKKQKTSLANALNNKGSISNKFSLNLLKTNEKLNELSKQKQKALTDLQQSESDKNRKIADLDIEINVLEDKQNITKWKTKIVNYFSCCRAIQKYSTVNQAISTRGITELGSKAHDELLTNSIRKSFEDELKALGQDVEVSLEKTGAGKGMVRTRLKILGKDIRHILSDGEQKAVGLALFLAEIESQNSGCPIVFDDPVTSVDHEVADSLAKKLLQISSRRQVVIFTHNQLFYDSLIFWGNNLKDEKNNQTHHICRNYTQKGCNGKGCHIYTYRVDREAKDKTGRVFEAQNESCGYFIEKAKKELKGDYSLGCVANYLKEAIEHYIDENILNNQCLMKHRKKRENIKWIELKKININSDKIDELKIHYDSLSDRGTHLTQNSKQIPLKTEDLNKIISSLEI